jgi:hypothetical protein
VAWEKVGQSNLTYFEAGGTFPQCPTCGPNAGWTLVEETVPSRRPEDATPDTMGVVTLRIFYPGNFFFLDAKIDAFLDGKPIGVVGSVTKGIDITVKTTTGRHALALHLLGGLRKIEYSIELPSAATYEVHLRYSRTWGNFTNDLQLRLVPAQGVAATPRSEKATDVKPGAGNSPGAPPIIAPPILSEISHARSASLATPPIIEPSTTKNASESEITEILQIIERNERKLGVRLEQYRRILTIARERGDGDVISALLRRLKRSEITVISH